MFRMIAAFPFSSWVFAFRTWVAMMTALYAAFWLQLDSASSAAATVGILALQTRGRPIKGLCTKSSPPSLELSRRL